MSVTIAGPSGAVTGGDRASSQRRQSPFSEVGIVRLYTAAVALVPLAVLVRAVPLDAQSQPATVVTGTLVGSDGLPMPFAHVHLTHPMRSTRTVRVQVEPDGRFAIAIARPGAYRLVFTGLDHAATTVPLLITAPTTLALDVRLRRHRYVATLDSVRAIGDFNGFRRDSGRALQRQPDGRYRLDVEVNADTLAYQLLGLDSSGSRTTAGTRADRYSLVDQQGYRSVIRVRDHRATIAFDPAALVRDTTPAQVRFRDSTSGPGRYYALLRDGYAHSERWMDAARAARAQHDSLRFDWGPVVAQHLAALRRERDPLARQFLLLQLIGFAQMGGVLDTATGWRVARGIPPTSPWWAFPELGSPGSMMFAYRTALGRTTPLRAGTPRDTAVAELVLGYLDRMIAEHPDSLVKGEALTAAIGFSEGARRNDYYLRFVRDFPNSPNADFINAQFAPNRVWRVGAAVPDFGFPSVDDSGVVYTPASLAGRTYLLDFWATWCGPCIADMPDLHAAHDSLASDGVEFLSVSLDATADTVRGFRRGEWRMPWLHAIAPGGWSNEQMRRLEILFVPRLVLVGSDGNVLAVDEALRGRSMVTTVRRVLAEMRRH
jgi:thiol-disulfide isomerase/thioredoxin